MKAALSLIVAGGALAFGLAAPAAAQGDRIARVIVYGNDPCPRGAGGEDIVGCGQPQNNHCRIPKELRDAPDTDLAHQSWANKAEDLEYVGRTGIQSCSTVGPGGWTGCFNQM